MIEVAVVIPSYNDLELVRRAAASAAEQSPAPSEIIIVNDGSDEAIARALTQSPPANTRVLHQENTGPAAARNRGVRDATSEIIVFLDSDDQLLPGALAAITDAFAQQNAKVVLGEPAARLDGALRERSPSKYESVAAAALDAPFRGAGVMAISKQAFESAGGFRDSMRALEDLDLLLRLAGVGPAVLVNQPTVLVEDRQGSLSKNLVAVSGGLEIIEQAFRSGEYTDSSDVSDLVHGIRRHVAVLAAQQRRPALATACYARAAAHALSHRNARFFLGLPALALWRVLGLPGPRLSRGARSNTPSFTRSAT